MKNVGWLSTDIQARIETPPIPIINLEVDDDCTTQIIKIKMQRNPSSVASKMYNANMNTVDNGRPEEFLSLLIDFNIATDGTRTTTQYGCINYVRTVLHGQVLR